MLQTNFKQYSIATPEPLSYGRILAFSILAGVVVAVVLISGYVHSNPIRDPFAALVLMFKFFLTGFVSFSVFWMLKEKYRIRQLTFNAERLETLLKNLPGMAYRCFNSQDWPMEFVSEGCYNLCGYQRNELENQDVLWGRFTHPDDIRRVEDSIRDAVSQERAFEVEYRIISREGKEKWVWERGRKVGMMDGESILEGLITDITDRKHAEQALMHAEAYSKAVVDTAVEGVITIDDDGYIETINRAVETMFSCNNEFIKDANIKELIHENSCEEYNHYISLCSSESHKNIKSLGCELTARRKDNSVFPIHMVVSKILNKPERRYVVLIRDLTKQRSDEKELRQQREQLAHVDRLNTLGEMATGIAHEINQPLTAISMYAQSSMRILENKKPDYEKAYDALDKLSIQAHRAGMVIERVQQLSKQHETETEIVDGNALIKEVYKLAEVEARIRDIVIVLDTAPLLPRVICDPVQIQQVVLNLLRNGMESMKEANCRNGNQIVLKTDRTVPGVKISVIDSGHGVPDELIEQLYRPFSTTKNAGMGMGLSISRSIVRNHGGKLEFNNNEGFGVTFHFTLPYAMEKKYD